MSNELLNIVDLTFDPIEDEKFSYWRNKHNIEIYNKYLSDNLPLFTGTSSISDNKDIDLIYNKYIKNAQYILEIGAGYGRVPEHLKKKGYKGSITCVERNRKFCNLLLSKFKENIEICEADIYEAKFSKQFDVALWLWSGFAEFAQPEQLAIFKKIASLIKNNGIMAIDSISIDNLEKSSNKINLSQHYFIKSQYGTCYRYFPSKDEFLKYAHASNVSLIETLPYASTFTGKKKLLLIFKQNML